MRSYILFICSSGGPMIDYDRKLIEKFERRDNRLSLCFYHNRILSRKNLKKYWGQIKVGVTAEYPATSIALGKMAGYAVRRTKRK